ncbi:MAG: hypothetical protein ABIJ56_13630 [Pseudomonadota bacterium]
MRKPEKIVCAAVLALAAAACGMGVPDDKSVLQLTIERESESVASGIVVLRFSRDGVEEERWSFLTDGVFPFSFEMWTALEGEFEVNGEGYVCPGDECRDVEGRDDLMDGRGSAGAVLSHGEKTGLLLVLRAVAGGDCGNGVIEEGESCDDGNDDPSDGCLADCSHPFRIFYGGAGGNDDSFAALVLADGFVAAWTVGAGDAAPSPDYLEWMQFDGNGAGLFETPQTKYPDSCAAGPAAVFGASQLSAVGGASPALLLWSDREDEEHESLCLELMDETGRFSSRVKLAGAATPQDGRPPLALLDPSHAAAVIREGGALILSIVDVRDGSEVHRAMVEQIGEGEQGSQVRLHFDGGEVLAAAWQKKRSDGSVASLLKRWVWRGAGEFFALDAAPLALGEDEDGGIRGIVLTAPPSSPGTIVLTRLKQGGIETVWLDSFALQQDFNTRVSEAGISRASRLEDCAAPAQDIVHVLLAEPTEDEGRCVLGLYRISGPGEGSWERLRTWGEEQEAGCSAGLLQLSGGRTAAIIRTLKETTPGIFKGELALEIIPNDS